MTSSTDPGEPCQPIIFLEDEPLTHLRGSDELTGVFRENGVSRTWVLHITEQAHQGGYNLGVSAADMELTPDGFQRHHSAVVMYRDLFSKAADAHSRGIDRNDRKADPKIGSKEARSLYWISGEPPRIESLVRQSPQGAADMLRYLLAFTEGRTYKQFKDKTAELPQLRDHAMFKESKCRAPAGICKMRVVDTTETRTKVLWAPGRDMPYMMSFNIPGLY